MSQSHGKVLAIVEETIQHIYLIDPEDPKAGEYLAKLRVLATGSQVETIPTCWDRPPAALEGRAKKAPKMPSITLREMSELHDAQFSTFSGLTIVLPDEEGFPALEQRFNSKTVSQKPLKRKKR